MSKTRRNDNCPCGSGKKYKRCCIDQGRPATGSGDGSNGQESAEIEAAKTPDGMAAERSSYAKKWSAVDAAAFAEHGHYTWMATQVRGFHRVLEVGTGDGRGTVELLRAGHEVVSVDENPECLRLAANTIGNAGFTVATKSRGAVAQGKDGYSVTYSPVVSTRGDGAVLIEGDTLNDPELMLWLNSQPRFDAVVCWLVGSHRARQLNVALPKEGAGSYRLRVQNGVYELAEAVLKPGGVLNLIDRGLIGTTTNAIELLRFDTVRSHSDQASTTTLKVDAEVATRPYEPAEGVKMELTAGLSGLVPADVQFGLTSVVARRA